MNSTAIGGFRKLCFTTLIAVYILILVGGIVRSTGSGMGCPDWPRCFGKWVPPTSAASLPADYKEINATFRDKKNQKFVRTLRAVGLNSTADRIEQDKTILKEADFDLTRTWTEYFNRLVGVAIGFLIVLLFWRSIRLRKERPNIFFYSLAVLILVIAQGWFGSIVVSTNLTTWTVTVHMFLALLMVWWLVYLYRLTEPEIIYPAAPMVRRLLLLCIVLVLVQIYLGTQVRESVDRLVMAGVPRESWILQLGPEFITHRTFSWLVILVNAILVMKLRKTSPKNPLMVALIVIILATVVAGVAMAYGGVPALLQPVHLTLATAALGLQLLLFYRLETHQKAVLVN